jgi:hypothetical protein
MSWVASLYNRRIINVNVNVVAAGIFALIITVGVMKLAEWWGFIEKLQGIAPDFSFELFGKTYQLHGHKLVISGMTFLVDLVADVAVYYGLHWVANHMPRRGGRPQTSTAYADLSFVRDATLVQFERAVLSPLLYIIALGLQNTLLHRGVSLETSTAVGFITGIAATRAVHTMWMLRQEEKALKRIKAAATAQVPPPLPLERPAPPPPQRERTAS